MSIRINEKNMFINKEKKKKLDNNNLNIHCKQEKKCQWNDYEIKR